MNALLPLRRFFSTGDRLLPFFLALAAFAALLMHTTRLGWFICDDAYITLRYARQWAIGGAPFFNGADAPVEGYTSFLWMAFLALAHTLHLDAAFVALLLSALAGAAVLIGLLLLMEILLPGEENRNLRLLSTIFTLALAAGFAPFAFWVSTGMETMFFTALLLFAVVASMRFPPTRKGAITLALLWAACALTRPEGIFLGLTAFGFLIACAIRNEGLHSSLLRRAAVSLSIFTALIAAHLFWRRLTYGQWLPLTYYAKISGIDPLFLAHHGAAYVLAFVSAFLLVPLVIAAGIALVFPKTGSFMRERFLIAGIILLTTAHVIRSGGDFMAMFRFLVPIWPLLVSLAAAGIAGAAGLLHRLPPFRRIRGPESLAIPLFMVCGLPVLISSWHFENASLASERPQFMMESAAGMIHFAQDRVRVGRILRAVLPEPVRSNTFMVVGGAGALSYESRIGRIVDTFGLLDPKVARMRIKTGSFTKPGHLKQASRERVRSFDADILCNPGVAWIGRGTPPEAWRKSLEAQWPAYTPFCVVARLSRDDRGFHRTHYCCLRKKNRLETLNMHTVAP